VKTIGLVFVPLILAAIAGGRATGQPAAEEGLLQTGRTLYVTHCATCHGLGARGDGPLGTLLVIRPADLTQMARRNGGTFPSVRAHRVIDGREVGSHGNPDMPVWGDVFKRSESLSNEVVGRRIEAIVQYLASIQEMAGQ
jgi:mono/diheme cytochrome c family protein